MSDTTFVVMYNPNLGNVQVDAPLQAVSTYQSHGWLLLDPNATAPPVASPYLSQPAADSRYLRDWVGGDQLTAGAVRVAPDGHVITRTADGTTRSTYDATEAALWTVVGAAPVLSVVGQVGAVSGTQIAADPALRAAYVQVGTTRLDLYSYGARCDWSGSGAGTDLAPAIAAALADVPVGGELFLRPPPNGSTFYRLASPFVLPTQTRLVSSTRATTIMVDTSGTWSGSPKVISLGSPGVFAFGTRLENLTLDCNDLAGSIGVYASTIQEQSGLRDILIRKAAAKGIFFDGSGADHLLQNYDLRDVEVYISSVNGGSTSIGIDIDGGSTSARGIEHVTVAAVGGASLGMLAGVRLNRAGGHYGRLHVEGAVVGVLIGDQKACAGTSIVGLTGNSNVTDLVKIAGAADASLNVDIVLMALRSQGATNVLNDQNRVAGGGAAHVHASSADSTLAYYMLGSGTAGTQSILCSSSTSSAGTNRNAHGNTFNAAGQTINSILSIAKWNQQVKSQTLAASGPVTIDASLGTIQEVILQANATSSTITNPQTGVSGRQRLELVVKQDATGSRTFAWPTTGIKYAGATAPTTSTAANRIDRVIFEYDGTTWLEVSRTLNVG